ncbi:hypothetical protein M409DRAFT_51707 [Zasmidium cellare ATCC 36951]|uniref:CENP-V/GFA domain-containing protein n=1 Tax=Zasmidium cellare ATCC 36951 TaxID=1080233 RepID=A0A6A6CUJ2_ZASCE|nr:uncharacterized protein M409DRAFT_51707 [Zasmidium cellare ATCC 36951]KAF2170715.1 hypothetical protein M409DRAFT_51707 [Zasmidium cellare ATCC 36951]
MSAKIPLPSEGAAGGESAETATATCYCGAVQLRFPTEGDGFVETFICNCTDCRKISASAFCTNFIVKQSATTHVRGREKLTKFAQDNTIATGNTMQNHFCSVCGILMYRISSGFPDMYVLRLGTVDDFALHEGKLRPSVEQFTKDRVSWFHGGEGVKQYEGNYYTGGKEWKSMHEKL